MRTLSRLTPDVSLPIGLALAVGLAFSSALAGQSSASSQQSGQARPPPSTPALEVLVEGGLAFMGNFFQAPAGEPRRNVSAATGAVQIVRPLGSEAEAFARVLGTSYSEFDPSGNVQVGARWGTRPHSFRGRAGYRWRMPRLDVGDTLAIANILHLGANYALRPARFIQLEALANYYDETHSRRAERANTLLDLGGALRYRGLDYLFSPELGAAFGTRDVITDTEDFDQRSLWITLRSMPTPAIYLSLRYRNRLREYTIGDPAASNFGRQDRRHQITLTTALSLTHDLRWTVYYSFDHATSTNVSRNFDTHYLWTGLRYRLAGGAGG